MIPTLSKKVDTFRNWRLDIIDNIVYVYTDGAYMAKFPMPNEAFNNKVGFTSGFAGTQYDYAIIEKLT
ncbi:hypothetical protein D3C84_1198050 [compost metagenome]